MPNYADIRNTYISFAVISLITDVSIIRRRLGFQTKNILSASNL